MKKISLKDIAEATHLSKTTVSFILNGKGGENNISKETIDRVLETARRLDYRPNFLAKSLLSGKSNTIGLIVPRITDTFFAQIATEVEQEALGHGYTVVYGSTQEDSTREQKLIDTFTGKQVDGLIIASSMRNHEGIKHLLDIKYPFVLIDRYYDDLMTPRVAVENEAASYRIVNTLIEKGYKNIALVTVSSHLPLMQERAAGYRKALADKEIEFSGDIIFEADTADMENSVCSIINHLLDATPKIDAIYFTTHYLASLGFKYLRDRQVAIPGDLAVCCFGDSPYLELLEPSITAIPMPAARMGREATRILLQQLTATPGAFDEAQIQITLPLHIASRNSW
ncbi:MAG: LacI family transcriptional regulator [Muribaculaceae bacterium]|nr:LacI family transcriptional regulator [Muribaculaceae bacterium]